MNEVRAKIQRRSAVKLLPMLDWLAGILDGDRQRRVDGVGGQGVFVSRLKPQASHILHIVNCIAANSWRGHCTKNLVTTVFNGQRCKRYCCRDTVAEILLQMLLQQFCDLQFDLEKQILVPMLRFCD